jgi:cytosine/adenosine deaminase-related metal-dependent hydrolase
MQMGHGVPPIQQALDAGVMPSLGVDVETSAPGDMWTQMRSVYGLQRMNAFKRRHAGEDAPAMIDCRYILGYATLAGAASARLDHKIGSLSVGKQADLVLLRADMLNVMPLNDMTSAVALTMDARNVDTVLVAGRVVKRGGRMIGIDLHDLASRLYESRDRLFRDAGIACQSRPHRMASH